MGCSRRKKGLVDPDDLGPEEKSLKCPNCLENIQTKIEKENVPPKSDYLLYHNAPVQNDIFCCFLMLFCCICAMTQCCFSCKPKEKIKHQCPKCDVHLGTFWRTYPNN